MDLNRRKFIGALGMLAAGTAVSAPAHALGFYGRKLKVTLVGTGVRGTSFWGKRLVDQYPDLLEFVGLSDINPGRLEYAKEYMGVDCPVYTDFDKMLTEQNPDLVIVTTVDSTHHEFIIKGLDYGCDVLTEKPLTTDEDKCQDILDAERRSDRKLIVGFNYRWSPYATQVKQLLHDNTVGKITSMDFHWYLNNYHGASYFRRWHGLRQYGGTLWVHKSTHHFDMINWWLDSDPVEVFAYGALEHYGDNGPFKGDKCRTCPHKNECDYFYDITKSERYMNLYVKNEKYDGYIRDNCLYRPEINIYDKMSAQIKYANGVIVNYSLTTYSPYEGWRTGINGHNGRIEAWQDIPYFDNNSLDQAALHAAEMNQQEEDAMEHSPVIVHKNFEDHTVKQVSYERGGHGGGDKRLQDKIFSNPDAPDPLRHTAGVRDGAMSILIGIAARKSIESGEPVRISELTDLVPRAKRI